MTQPSKQNKRDEARQRAAVRHVRDLTHKAQLSAQALADARAHQADLAPSAQGSHPVDQLMRDQMKRYGDQATAEKVCGAIRAGKAANPLAPTEAELAAIETELGVKALPEAERKDWYDDDFYFLAPYRPYGGATSLADALAAMDAQEQANAIQQAAWMFQDITSNILNDPTITDKAAAITTAAGELQDLLNDPTPLMKDTPPAEGAPAAAPALEVKTPAAAPTALTMPGTFQVFKGLDGAYYALGRVTNKWRDRDVAKHPKGEIITDAAHKEFVAYLNASPALGPELWSWHTPGTARKSRAVWWDYADGFVSMLWPLEESEAKQFDPSETLGMSHGFYVLERDAAQGLITKYRSFEGSELPPEWTANPWTSLEVLKEAKAMSFSPDQRNFLVKRFGEERVSAIEADTANLAKALDLLGVESKSAEAPAAAPAAPAGPEAEEAFETLKHILNVEGLNTVITTLQEQNKTLAAQAALVPELQKKLETLDAAVKQLTKTDDEKMADQIQPKIKPITWGFQASADDKSKLTDAEKDKFKTQKPTTSEGKGTSWVGEVFSPIGAPAA